MKSKIPYGQKTIGQLLEEIDRKVPTLPAGGSVLGLLGRWQRHSNGLLREGVRSFILTFHSSLILFVNFKDLTLPLFM